MSASPTPDTNPSFTCPACRKLVFNRRYPRCEFCGAILPAEVAYDADERRALFEADRISSEQAWRLRKAEEEERERTERERGG